VLLKSLILYKDLHMLLRSLAFGALFSTVNLPFLLMIQSPPQPIQLTYVSGLVTDNLGASLPGVTITFKSKKIEKRIVAAGDGRYELELPPGTYEVKGRLQGCKDFRLRKWTTKSDRRSTLNISLYCQPTPIH
jgi:Carboxypeptidase regulatory-like domain